MSLAGPGTPWHPALSPWDLALLVVGTIMGTLLAYINDPKWKAFLLGLPFPFTIANLSLAQQVGPSHVLGMVVLLLLTNLVRWLHYSGKVPIVPAIALSVGVYIGAGSLLNWLVPSSAAVFWIVFGLTLCAGILLLVLLPHRRETAHRSPLPVPVKIAVEKLRGRKRRHAFEGEFGLVRDLRGQRSGGHGNRSREKQRIRQQHHLRRPRAGRIRFGRRRSHAAGGTGDISAFS